MCSKMSRFLMTQKGETMEQAIETVGLLRLFGGVPAVEALEVAA